MCFALVSRYRYATRVWLTILQTSAPLNGKLGKVAFGVFDQIEFVDFFSPRFHLTTAGLLIPPQEQGQGLTSYCCILGVLTLDYDSFAFYKFIRGVRSTL